MKKQLTAIAVLTLSLVTLCTQPETIAPIEPGYDSLPSGKTAILQPSQTLHNSIAVINLADVSGNAANETPQATPAETIPTPTGAVLGYATTVEAKRVGTRAVTVDGTIYPVHQYRSAAIPNDPQANQAFVTTANLSAAWDVPQGATPTLLAIIDTGFALNHQEFANRFYTNPGELGVATSENPSLLNCTARTLPLNLNCNLIDDDGDGFVDNEVGPTTRQNPSRLNCTAQSRSLAKDCNLRDDDMNGFIDDVTGWDFINNDRSVQAGEVTPTGDGTHHGTYVSGVAAATGNNGVGIAGVDWNTKILPIQALDDEGYGDTVAVANAIDYAVARNANVISLSLGSDGDDELVHQAVRRAIAAGVLVVAAAGNDGCNCMLYPANYPEVIAVGASQSNGQPASFSSYGANLDILAPGVNLYTTDWQAGNQTSAYASGISGTSLATPIVSGLLTRLISQRPNANSTQLLAALTESTNKVGLTATTPRTNTLGYGLLDASRVTQRLKNAYSPVQIYNLARVNTGISAGTAVYTCEPSTFGSTPIYELIRSGTTKFSINTVEVHDSIAQGFSANIFTHGCVSQPHDTPQNVRNLNVFSEFRNSFVK